MFESIIGLLLNIFILSPFQILRLKSDYCRVLSGCAFVSHLSDWKHRRALSSCNIYISLSELLMTQLSVYTGIQWCIVIFYPSCSDPFKALHSTKCIVISIIQSSSGLSVYRRICIYHCHSHQFKAYSAQWIYIHRNLSKFHWALSWRNNWLNISFIAPQIFPLIRKLRWILQAPWGFQSVWIL